ncbi:MAG: Flp pilus assembly protein ATPase CpaF, partial [Actinomycetia bacterium]|nr:Flp pilus assembly protein ATPase CpaF [Actinomycetes bacterium]
GAHLTIRRFRRRPCTLADFQVGEAAASLLSGAVAAGRNIVVAGGTSTGKTTLVNVLAGAIDATERVVTIEETAELALPGPHVVRLEARPANAEGVGAVTVRDLVRTSLRMRPDRIIVGEVRGGEALDLLLALNTGHAGSLATVHANRAADALARLETLTLMAGVGLPHAAIRAQIGSAVDLVVTVARDHDGSRRVVEVGEVSPDGGSVHPMTILRDGELAVVDRPRRPGRRLVRR